MWLKTKKCCQLYGPLKISSRCRRNLKFNKYCEKIDRRFGRALIVINCCAICSDFFHPSKRMNPKSESEALQDYTNKTLRA